MSRDYEYGDPFDVEDLTLGEWIYMNCRDGDRLEVRIDTRRFRVSLINHARRAAITTQDLSQRDAREARAPMIAPKTTPPTKKPG